MQTNIVFIRLTLLSAVLMVPGTSANAAPITSPPSFTGKNIQSSVPHLIGSGDAAKKNTLAFIDWASASTQSHDDAIRRQLGAAGGNKAVVDAFCNEAIASQKTDHDRALVVLSLLGEMRSLYSKDCLSRLVAQPLHERGTVVEGEIIEQTALATLQAKAIDGLAYLKDDRADQVVLQAVAQNPSRIVRAEAIAAYLWNHGNSAVARKTLMAYVHRDEAIYIDRIVRQAGEKAAVFNNKLAVYLKTHPEVIPPKPLKAKPKNRAKSAVGQPPNL
jgi:hypothetical protein